MELSETDYSPLWFNLREQPSFWSALLGIGFSIWLMLGSRGLVRVLRFARESAESDVKSASHQ